MSYSYDVFISYRHAGVVRDWVLNHFHPRLQEWLNAASLTEVSVFVDELSVETGSDLPEAIRQALSRSKVMVPVYSPQYFSSSWCQTEFHTMVERLRRCGLPTSDDPRTLVVPVKFNDGDHFTELACGFKYDDFSSFAQPYPVYAESVGYLEFANRVKALADTIVGRFDAVPPWDSDWPLIEVKPGDHRLISSTIELPTL